MSVCSYFNVTCTFPKDTKIYKQPYSCELVETSDGRYEVGWESEGDYSNHLFDELVEMFGKPLDEVPGLYLDSFYHYYEDEGWQFMIEIKDGEVKCSETEIVWKPTTVETAGIDIGRPNVEKAREIWERLGDVLVDDDGRLLDLFHVPGFGYYPKGTDREEVWHEIESKYHVSVAYLMGEAKNPDGTND